MIAHTKRIAAYRKWMKRYTMGLIVDKMSEMNRRKSIASDKMSMYAYKMWMYAHPKSMLDRTKPPRDHKMWTSGAAKWSCVRRK